MNTLRASSTVSGFQTAVAFYPPCELAGTDTITPLLMLLAGSDDWTPPNWCVTTGEILEKRNRPVRWVIYPTAVHGFDQPLAPRRYLGHLMVYDSAATAASREEVRRFLAEFLK